VTLEKNGNNLFITINKKLVVRITVVKLVKLPQKATFSLIFSNFSNCRCSNSTLGYFRCPENRISYTKNCQNSQKTCFLGENWTKKKLVESRRWKKLGYPIFICPRGKEKYGRLDVVFQIHFFLFYSTSALTVYETVVMLCFRIPEKSVSSSQLILSQLARHKD
jgi:hypothetical protein